MTILKQYAEIASDFVQVAALAGISIPLSDIRVQFCAAPHEPSNLPPDRSAVYVFMLADRCLKVGKAGPNGTPRFRDPHYGSKAPSTLAKSLMKRQASLRVTGLDEANVKAWICEHTSRVNFLIPAKYDPFALSLLEAFVQCRLRPEFEGFASQHVQPQTAA